MMPDRWEEVSALFEEALDDPGRLAAADPELLSEVRRLLDFHHRAEDFLDQAPVIPPDFLAGDGTRETPYAGRVLGGRYRLAHEIGRGGAGLVFFAHDQTLHGRPVVVKILHAHWLGSTWMRERFRQESEALSRLDHPGIVRILDVAETESHELFLVLEYREGPILRSEIGISGMNTARAVGILVQLGEALDAAHAQGVLHRDLKPENILLTCRPDGSEQAILLDFGIAKMESPDDTGTTTFIAGTMHYMAPEQLRGHPSRASDTFALAVVAHEMLTGKRPNEHLDWTVKPKLNGLPAPVRRVLEGGLHPKEAARPSSPGAFSRDLRTALEDPIVSRRAVLLRTASAVAATGIATAAFWYWNDSRLLLPEERVVEYSGALGPFVAGFGKNLNIEWYSEMNPSRTRYDHIRVESADQGQYYRRLSSRQKKAALANGWKLTALYQVDLGLIPCVVDFAGYGNRFDMCLLHNKEDGYLVALNTQLAPEFAFERVTLKGTPGGYHLCELTYNPTKKSAALSVDGVARYDGYRGHTQSQEDFGFVFGAGLYRSAKAVGRIQKVRFEIFS